MAVDRNEVERLTASPLDMGAKGYERIREELVLAKKEIPKCCYMYLLGMKNGKVVFLVDSTPVSDPGF